MDLEAVMKFPKYSKILAFVATGGVLLQATGCDSTSLLGSLASALVPLAVQLLLSGLGT